MSDEPRAQVPDGPILLCAGTDADASARLAELAAALLAQRPVVVLTSWNRPPLGDGVDAVMDALHGAHAELRTAARRAAAEAARAACEVLDARGFDVTRRVCADERAPWRVILEIAGEVGAAVIVAGAHDGHGGRPGGIGREVRALAHRTRRPLLVLPPDAGPADAAATALFAFDGSAPAEHALRSAAALLAPRQAVAACVWQSAAYAVGVATLAIPDEIARSGAARIDEASRDEAERHARYGASLLAEAGWSCETIALQTARSVPGALILAAEDHDAAVVVTGTRGRSRVAAAVLGSSAEAVLRHAGRPVLLVPPAAEEDPTDAS